MDRYIEKSRRYLWAIAEIGFLIVLVSVLIHIVLGPLSGGFVKGVYDNLVSLGRDVPAATLIGIAALMLLVWQIQRHIGGSREEDTSQQ